MDGRRHLAAWVGAFVAACGVALVARAQTPDDSFDVASAHYARGWYDKAADGFGEFADKFPDDARASDARFYQAEAALAANELDVARTAFEALLDATATEERRAHAEFRLGDVAFRQERFDAAASLYEGFLVARPDHPFCPNAAMQAGHAHWKRGAFEAAEQAYQEGLRRVPGDGAGQEFRLALARVHAALGRHADAIRFYEVVLERLPEKASVVEVRRELAESRLAVEQWLPAAEDMLVAFDAAQAPSDKTDLAVRRMEALARAGAWDALDAFATSETGAAAIEDSPPAKALHADALEKLAKPEAADALRTEVVASDASVELRAGALRRLTLRAFERGDAATAIALLERHADLVAAADFDGVLRPRLARAYLAAKQAPRAEKALRECLELKTLNDDARAYVLYDLGVARGMQEDPAGALDAFRQVPDTAPNELSRAVCLAAADAASYAEDWAVAEEFLRRLLALDGEAADDAVRRRLFVAVANRAADDAEAARLLRAFDSDEDADAFYWSALDRFLTRVQHDDEALYVEFAARRRTGAAPDALRAKSLVTEGFAALAAERLDEAEDAFQEASELAPEGPVARDAAWGRLELAAHKKDLAALDGQIARLRKLDADETRMRQADLLRSRTAYAAGDVEESVAELERLVAKLDADDAPDQVLRATALFELAGRLTEIGRDEDSAAAYERVVASFPNSPFAADAAYRLAERDYRSGDGEACERRLAKLIESSPRTELLEFAWYLRGQNAARGEAWDRVAACMESLLAASPESALRFEAEYWLAESAFRRKDFAAAGTGFDSLAEKLGAGEPAWKGMISLRRAQVLAAGSRFADAHAMLESFEKSFPEFRQQYEVDYLRGRCLARLGRFEEARSAFDAVVRSPWGGAGEISAMAQWMIGETYFHQERFEEAVRAYDLVEAKHAFPEWQATALLQAGKCYERLERPDEAARSYAYLIKNHGDSPLVEEATRRLRATSARPRQALRQANLK